MNGIFRQARKYDRLTPEQRQRAWQSAFVFSLDLHPDVEIAWEADRWRELGASGIAALCEALLQEREADDFSIPAEVSRQDLDLLWQRVPRTQAMEFVRVGGQCLIAALRLTYWLSLSPEEIAA
jgi:hypothetical protein